MKCVVNRYQIENIDVIPLLAWVSPSKGVMIGFGHHIWKLLVSSMCGHEVGHLQIIDVLVVDGSKGSIHRSMYGGGSNNRWEVTFNNP